MNQLKAVENLEDFSVIQHNATFEAFAVL